VRYAFYAGGSVLLLSILWTVLRTREYPPEVLASFDDARPGDDSHAADGATPSAAGGLPWLLVGIVAVVLVWRLGWDRLLYVLATLPLAYGLLRTIAPHMRRGSLLPTVTADLHAMPGTMRQLALVQFFSWFGLFCMWIYTTAAVTRHHYATTDTASAAWNEGANWVGVLFAAYNGFAALAAIAIPWLARRFGLRGTHLLNLWLGGLGLLSVALLRDPQWLLLSMVGVGFAWASILSLPYAMLSDSLPAAKMGVYMGIFNFFIVIPQLVAVSTLGVLLSRLFDGDPLRVLMLGAACLFIAGLCTLRVRLPLSHALRRNNTGDA
jgi:maltose/moltooligosaccharide transporter